jgi:GNAT superfamily N-acetyltransferase
VENGGIMDRKRKTNKRIEIKEYAEANFDDMYRIVHKTIEEIYPKYYPRIAVVFFHSHHSKENMIEKLPKEITLLLFEGNKTAGTASLFHNEIGRFFVLPEYQGKGYGRILLQELEKKVDSNKYDEIILDSSLGAVSFYQKNKYTFRNYKTINLSGGGHLCYLEMAKNIQNPNAAINYDNKVFLNLENTKNETRTGKCHSFPEILENGCIALCEKWEWTNGDKSKGESKIIEKLSGQALLGKKVYT